MQTLVTVIFLLFSLTLSACSGKAPIGALSGLRPGMECGGLTSYFKEHRISSQKRGSSYRIGLNGPLWKEVKVDCGTQLDRFEFRSSSLDLGGGRSYIEFEDSLMDIFRNEKIFYEEGLRVVNFNNGVKLHQFVDEASGTVDHFNLSVEGIDNMREVWEKVFRLLVEVENKG